jgi:DNA-binding CsgD family transcriptional regulator/tetratricopeptide (TPR) repeat protein
VGIVGRAEELTELRAGLARAADGHGSAWLIAGDAGIGKTRVVTELADVARAGGALVLSGRCLDLIGPGVPYFALLDALRSARAEAPGALAWPAERYAPADVDAQSQLFEAVQSMLDDAAAARPVVLIVEDLHWADVSTLDFIRFLCRMIRDRRIMLIATYRDDDLRPGDPLAGVVIELARARDVRVLELAPLDPAGVRALLELRAGRALPGELTDEIAARSAGNPFFAEELLAAGRTGEALPRLLRDALLRRISGTDPTTRELLRLAAAFGRDVPYRVLERLSSLPRAEVAVALRQAVDHGILVPDQASSSYRFRHALLAEAVYGTVLPGEAEQLHERIATALGEDPCLGGDGAGAGELARHWDAAGRPAEALAALARAARDAEAGCGLAEALRHLERAIELWPDVPAAEKVAEMDRPAVLAWAAELADLTGRGHRAAELIRAAVELVDAEADPVRAGLFLERLGGYLLPIGGEGSAAIEACRRAAELVPAQPPTAERARVLTTLANALMLSWRHDESHVVCREVLTTAEAIGDPRPALRARAIMGVDLCYLGQPDWAREQVLAARHTALEWGSRRDIVHTYALVCEVLMVTGRPDEAGRMAMEGLTQARRLGTERSFGALLAGYAAEALLETGEWSTAAELLVEQDRYGTAFWAHYPRLLHAQLAIARGETEAARRHLVAGAHGQRQPTSAARYARVVAELALTEGRPAVAARVGHDALTDPVAGVAAIHRVRLGALGLRGEADGVERSTDGLDAARRRADRLLDLTHRAATEAAAITPDAGAWRATAEAEHARLDPGPGGATEAWRVAAATWDALDRPYPAAYCRWRLVESLFAQAPSRGATPSGEATPGEAVRAAREAHRVAAELGAAPLVREIELLAQRARLDLTGPPPAPRPEPADGLGLTGRESEVLGLLARGYTNRQIAAELTISVKTASVHVSNILRKLGVSRRIDAATIAHRVRRVTVR